MVTLLVWLLPQWEDKLTLSLSRSYAGIDLHMGTNTFTVPPTTSPGLIRPTNMCDSAFDVFNSVSCLLCAVSAPLRCLARGLRRHRYQCSDQISQQEGDRSGRRLLQSSPVRLPVLHRQGRSLSLSLTHTDVHTQTEMYTDRRIHTQTDTHCSGCWSELCLLFQRLK